MSDEGSGSDDQTQALCLRSITEALSLLDMPFIPPIRRKKQREAHRKIFRTTIPKKIEDSDISFMSSTSYVHGFFQPDGKFSLILQEYTGNQTRRDLIDKESEMEESYQPGDNPQVLRSFFSFLDEKLRPHGSSMKDMIRQYCLEEEERGHRRVDIIQKNPDVHAVYRNLKDKEVEEQMEDYERIINREKELF